MDEGKKIFISNYISRSQVLDRLSENKCCLAPHISVSHQRHPAINDFTSSKRAIPKIDKTYFECRGISPTAEMGCDRSTTRLLVSQKFESEELGGG